MDNRPAPGLADVAVTLAIAAMIFLSFALDDGPHCRRRGAEPWLTRCAAGSPTP